MTLWENNFLYKTQSDNRITLYAYAILSIQIHG